MYEAMHEAMHTNQYLYAAHYIPQKFPMHDPYEHKFTFLDLTKFILGLTFKSWLAICLIY